MIKRKFILDGGQLSLSAHGLPLHAIIEEREDKYPVIKVCQKCALECKKHGAKDLKFQCFEFSDRRNK